MSLKAKLNILIKNRGIVPIEEIYKFILEEGYKISNGERRLRKSESPNVEPVMSKSRRGTKYISAYKWRQEETIEIPLAGKVENEKVYFTPQKLKQLAEAKSKLL